MGDPFRCRDCGAWFEDLEDLDRHMTKRHPVDPMKVLRSAGFSWAAIEIEESRKLLVELSEAVAEDYSPSQSRGRRTWEVLKKVKRQ